MPEPSRWHVPVLADQAVEALVWRNDGSYVDATVGDGGHAEKICERLAGGGRLLALDRDPEALERAADRLNQYKDRVIFVRASFARLDELVENAKLGPISGILFDLGVSSRQLDEPERGFSHRLKGPIDMRMGPDTETPAATIVNEWPERELARLFRVFGEEPHAASIARSICQSRSRRPLTTTSDLVEAIGRRGTRPEKTLSRVFQALRIAVNDELASLKRVLELVPDMLERGGRLVVISYHSLEDRAVKEWIRMEARGCICPPIVPECRCGHFPRMRTITRRAVVPTSQEIAENSRSRSARMRVAERL
ncbi:MAG: Ribosomal RNA small subunit methyltransferase H [Candidatus Latescibacteria bacterium ADurb.Bin168]|nr:MAG: Ribosomal RNA small subunit methyltransferase H [Candidatus Latescibacteria bacterium ADurb.Bin168]